MTNSVLSDVFKSQHARLLVIDDHQLRYNQILEIFKQNTHPVQATLLDDVSSFEKQLNFEWDMVIFARAYDLKIQQAIALIQSSQQPNLPIIMFSPDGYQTSDYAQYIQRGIYEIVDLNQTEHFYISVSRALAYSRLLQAENRLNCELINAQNHAQNLAQERNHANAIIQEGIHFSANDEYLALFGIPSQEELIGLPLLDLLQPDDINAFKQRFKKLSQGQFDGSSFEIKSLNSHLQGSACLRLEFLPCEQDDALQLSIDYSAQQSGLNESYIEQTAPNTARNTPQNHVLNSVDAPASKYNSVNELLARTQYSYSALLLITLAKCPELVFQDDWHTFKDYFHNTFKYLAAELPHEVVVIENGVYVAVIAAQSASELQQQLIQLNRLEKQVIINVNNTTMPLSLRLSWYRFKTALQNDQQMEALLAQAFTQRLPAPVNEVNTSATVIEPVENTITTTEKIIDEPLPLLLEVEDSSEIVELTAEHIEQVKTQTPLLFKLEQKLQNNEIQLKYQQLYDKQDSNLNIYEVTASFKDENQHYLIQDLKDLYDDADLSIQLDRWIMVEACKQLHKFIQKYPKAKLIINLNQHILYQDKQLSELVAKLLTVVASKQDYPLILQFSEDALSKNMVLATQQVNQLKEQGAEISMRGAGSSVYTEQILRSVTLDFIKLADPLSNKLKDDHDLEHLQQQVDHFISLQPLEVITSQLDDMNLFANAWNVNARYLQGDYFQKQLDKLTDVQDQ